MDEFVEDGKKRVTVSVKELELCWDERLKELHVCILGDGEEGNVTLRLWRAKEVRDWLNENVKD